jgi:gas vesicle protein
MILLWQKETVDFGALLHGFYYWWISRAVAALLLAPRIGRRKTRNIIKTKSIELKDKAAYTTEEAMMYAEKALEEAKAKAEMAIEETRAWADELAKMGKEIASDLQKKGQVVLEEQKAKIETLKGKSKESPSETLLLKTL